MMTDVANCPAWARRCVIAAEAVAMRVVGLSAIRFYEKATFAAVTHTEGASLPFVSQATLFLTRQRGGCVDAYAGIGGRSRRFGAYCGLSGETG